MFRKVSKLPIRQFTSFAFGNNKGLVAQHPFVVTKDQGFLPRSEPISQLPDRYHQLESLLQKMTIKLPDGTPGLLGTGNFGRAVNEQLPVYDASSETDGRLLMALFRDLTFAASAYLLEPTDLSFRKNGQFSQGRDILPRSIAVPLHDVSKKLGAKPFMEYAQSYALYNWKKKDSNGPVHYDNLQLIRKFSGLSSEHGFILVHVDMVSHSGKLVSSVAACLGSIENDDRQKVNQHFESIISTMQLINKSMETMWKHSLSSDYMKFRTFIMGTKNQDSIFPNGVIYEGVSDEPRYFRGESGANDSIVPTVDNFLQLTQKMPTNEMTEILKDFRSYRPQNHSEWLQWVESSAKRVSVADYCKRDEYTLALYILLLDQLRNFRERHWNFAKEYIIRRTKYPKATGGSPMATWLPNQYNAVLDEIISSCDTLMARAGMDSHIKRIYTSSFAQKKRLQKEVSLLTK